MTYKDRPLVQPVKLRGKPVEEVLQAFYAKENSTRYRARLELTSRTPEDIQAKVGPWAAQLDPQIEEQAQAMLECLWVYEEQRIVNLPLLQNVFQAKDGRVRAAAIRTLGHWAGKVENWEPLLSQAANDSSGLVRAEAVKAAVEFGGLTAAEVIFRVATQPTDPELNTVLAYAQNNLKVDKIVSELVASGKPLSPAAERYVLRNASVNDLLKLEKTEAVYEAILTRRRVPRGQLSESLAGLASKRGVGELELLMQLINERNQQSGETNLDDLAALLAGQPQDRLRGVAAQLKQLAVEGASPAVREAGFTAWIMADQSAESAFASAQESKTRLKDFLFGLAKVPDEKLRAGMFSQLRDMLFELPGSLKNESNVGAYLPGIRVDYFEPHSPNAAIETLARREPNASGVVPEIKMDVPQLRRRDEFSLRFTGSLRVDRAGDYIFFTNSDDGSRLYIGDQLVVNNDGSHGMKEVRGRIRLEPGQHPITVIYFDSGGGDGLVVSWRGPGFGKSKIPADRLSVDSGDTLHDIAMKTMDSIPGFEKEKFAALSKLVQSKKLMANSIDSMLKLSPDSWEAEQLPQLAETLAKYISEIPARYRTLGPALQAMELTDKIAARLPKEQAAQYRAMLAELKINVIRIGTVPERMIYDKEKIVVQAGKPVEFAFLNTDNMPHNFVIVRPGALEEVGTLAEETAQEKQAQLRDFVPESDKILLSSRLLQPQESQALSFEVPKEPGIYPFVCTYPGHWRRMYGALYVVEDIAAYNEDPAAYLAAAKLPMRDELLKYLDRNTEWTMDALKPVVASLGAAHDHGEAQSADGHGRTFDVAKNLFKVANCTSCHKMNGEGREFGPDLTKLDPDRYDPEKILQSLLDPSKEIDEKYQTQSFEMEDGEIITGLVVKESSSEVQVVIDPIANPEPRKLKKAEVFDRSKVTVSTMPKGLLNKFSEEEILDIISYVLSKGDKDHKLFQEHQHK